MKQDMVHMLLRIRVELVLVGIRAFRAVVHGTIWVTPPDREVNIPGLKGKEDNKSREYQKEKELSTQAYKICQCK